MFSFFLHAFDIAPLVRPSVGCLGKLPSHGDFLRRNAALPEAAGLDGWIREGILATQGPLGRFWDSMYDLAPPTRLYFLSPETRRALSAFVLAASDSVGRRYPFFLFRIDEMRGPAASVGRLAAAAEPFLTRARDVAALGHRAGPRSGFLSGVDALGTERGAGLCAGSLERWMESRTAGELFAGALGDAGDPRRALLAAGLQAACKAGPEVWRVLRLPPCEHAGDLGFWLDLLERFSGGRLRTRMVLWNESVPGCPSRPILVRDRIEPQDFRLFLSPGVEDSRILDPMPPLRPAPDAVKAANSRLGTSLENLSLPLRDLAAALTGRA